MTIVAGFRFDDGILICGDTKQTGNTVQHRSKIHAKQHPSGARSVFAIAGRSRLARMAVEECQDAIERINAPTLQEMKDAIIDVLITFHRKHIFPHPLRGQVGGPDFNLMVGLWSPFDNVGLYLTEETALDEVPVFDCIGTGEYLGRYIIEPRNYGPSAALKDVLFTAITALGRIKKFDPDCGGKSEFVVLRRNGDLTHEQDYDITQSEAFADTFYTMVTVLYTQIANSPFSEEEVKKNIAWFLEGVSVARSNLQTQKDRRESLVKALSRAFEAGREKAAGE